MMILSYLVSNTPCNPIDKCGLALSNFGMNAGGCCIKGGCELMTPNEINNLISSK